MSRSKTTSGGGAPASTNSAAHSAAVRSTRGSVSVPGAIVIGMTRQATSTSRGGVSAGGAGDGAGDGADSTGAAEGVGPGASEGRRDASVLAAGEREGDAFRTLVAGVAAGFGVIAGVGAAFPGFTSVGFTFPGARYPSERSASFVASSGVAAGLRARARPDPLR